MSATTKNPVWAFLASVHLALLLIGLLASTSIIGTVVQQNKPAEHYAEAWGKSGAAVIQALNLDDMYSSGWFLFLLGAFSLNLTICSIDRLPGVIRLVRKDNLDTEPSQLLKMKLQQSVQVKASPEAAQQEAASYLAGKGWKTAARAKEDGILLFAQKGAWTRCGVYVVHISILIILLGAVIGSPAVAKKILKNPQFAFKGSVSLPETVSANRIFAHDGVSEIPLGFSVRCNFFKIDYYDNGMVKAFTSGISILEQDKEVLNTIVEVNKPLIYKGVTFYQASYSQLENNQIIHLKNVRTGKMMAFPVNPEKWDATHTWEEGGSQGMLRIQDAENDADGHVLLNIWLMDSLGPPSMFTVPYNTAAVVERPDTKYEFKVGPHFATGLQAVKDPGVWWVYSGCGLMLLGLYVAFFMSHRKLWVYLREQDGAALAVFIGNANKNSQGFETAFNTLAAGFARRNG